MKTKTVYKRDKFSADDKPSIDEISLHWLPDFDDEIEGEGCVAKAIVSRPIGQGCRRLETLTSGGLWGIDERNQSDEDYQLQDLKEHLQAFGIAWFEKH